MPILFAKSTKIRSLSLYIFFCLAITYFVAGKADIPFIGWWFIVVNSMMFLSFGKDKLYAKMEWSRTPESTFLIMGLLGAFPAIFLGRKIFKHKTTKKEFVIPMWILFVLQVIAAIIYMEQAVVKNPLF